MIRHVSMTKKLLLFISLVSVLCITVVPLVILTRSKPQIQVSQEINYQDTVLVIRGFYKGLQGLVESQLDRDPNQYRIILHDNHDTRSTVGFTKWELQVIGKRADLK